MSSTRAATPTDYTTWSHADLLARVTALEAQLSARTQSTTDVSPAVRGSSSSSGGGGGNSNGKKASAAARSKPAKAFDRSRYATRLIALKFAYLGGNYNGYEHHANNTTPLPTVEEELFKALWKTRLVLPAYDATGQKEGEVCWEGTEYSKCGRTDRGVSAFGQVVGVRVRSAKPRPREAQTGDDASGSGEDGDSALDNKTETPWDPIRDELPYIRLLNRVLPPDIRILAWCPNPPSDFSARFNCKERRYRYFFSNPAFVPALSGKKGEGQLDVAAMQEAAQRYEGLHDFRNLCKVDPSKQITNFQRRIFHAGIHEVESTLDPTPHAEAPASILSPKLYYFEVRGSAFLWHQVRHLVAILFLVGQGFERPSIVDELLNIEQTPTRPAYPMASDTPLVLWDCVFPKEEDVVGVDYGLQGEDTFSGYEDSMDWIHVGGQPMRGVESGADSAPDVDDTKYGRNGIIPELWALWRGRKMDEILAGSLLKTVAGLGGDNIPSPCTEAGATAGDYSDRVFDGSGRPLNVGPYIPLMQRARMETPEVVNARYAARKGLNIAGRNAGGVDGDE